MGYSILTSKRRIGAFAVKGWLAGKSYSTLVERASTDDIHPWTITGFTDAEGYFGLGIRKDLTVRSGWKVEPIFSIGLHEKDRAVLEQIRSYFGMGKITNLGSKGVQFRVTSLKDWEKLIVHFDKYTLTTQKRGDYLLWCQAIKMIQQKEHLTAEGLKAIAQLKASMNRGLPAELK